MKKHILLLFLCFCVLLTACFPTNEKPESLMEESSQAELSQAEASGRESESFYTIRPNTKIEALFGGASFGMRNKMDTIIKLDNVVGNHFIANGDYVIAVDSKEIIIQDSTEEISLPFLEEIQIPQNQISIWWNLMRNADWYYYQREGELFLASTGEPSEYSSYTSTFLMKIDLATKSIENYYVCTDQRNLAFVVENNTFYYLCENNNAGKNKDVYLYEFSIDDLALLSRRRLYENKDSSKLFMDFSVLEGEDDFQAKYKINDYSLGVTTTYQLTTTAHQTAQYPFSIHEFSTEEEIIDVQKENLLKWLDDLPAPPIVYDEEYKAVHIGEYLQDGYYSVAEIKGPSDLYWVQDTITILEGESQRRLFLSEGIFPFYVDNQPPSYYHVLTHEKRYYQTDDNIYFCYTAEGSTEYVGTYLTCYNYKHGNFIGGFAQPGNSTSYFNVEDGKIYLLSRSNQGVSFENFHVSVLEEGSMKVLFDDKVEITDEGAIIDEVLSFTMTDDETAHIVFVKGEEEKELTLSLAENIVTS